MRRAHAARKGPPTQATHLACNLHHSERGRGDAIVGVQDLWHDTRDKGGLDHDDPLVRRRVALVGHVQRELTGTCVGMVVCRRGDVNTLTGWQSVRVLRQQGVPLFMGGQQHGSSRCRAGVGTAAHKWRAMHNPKHSSSLHKPIMQPCLCCTPWHKAQAAYLQGLSQAIHT